MKKAAAVALVDRVAGALAAIGSRGNLLEDIAWGPEVAARFFAEGEGALPKPDYAVDRAGLEGENAALLALEASVEGDEAIPVWLRSVVHAIVDKNRLLLGVGKRAFGAASREIFGGARTRFFGLPISNLDLAEHALERLRVHGWDEAPEDVAPRVDADALKGAIERRVARHRPALDVHVVVDPKCTSKAIAGATRVRIRPDATFTPTEIDGLYAHEVETHLFTAQNGAAQPSVPFLRSGGPRTTPTQEGLAVFAELYEHALDGVRLERLALRVRLVAMAEDGASFLDCHRFLTDRGIDKRDAFLDTTRIFRGGPPAGGAPFTKDACYLAGLVHVHAFLAAFVRGGFRDETEMIVCGRIALDDIVALTELRAMGVLERPRHRPKWLRGWSTLVPYFAVASFVEGIDLAPVEQHYRALITMAEAARQRG